MNKAKRDYCNKGIHKGWRLLTPRFKIVEKDQSFNNYREVIGYNCSLCGVKLDASQCSFSKHCIKRGIMEPIAINSKFGASKKAFAFFWNNLNKRHALILFYTHMKQNVKFNREKFNTSCKVFGCKL